MLLDVRVADEGDGQVVIALTGELDLGAEQALTNVVTAAVESGASHLVLDLRAITFVDSRGLGLLLVIRRRVDEARVGLAIRAPSHPVRQLLELSRLDQLLPIEDEASHT